MLNIILPDSVQKIELIFWNVLPFIRVDVDVDVARYVSNWVQFHFVCFLPDLSPLLPRPFTAMVQIIIYFRMFCDGCDTVKNNLIRSSWLTWNTGLHCRSVANAFISSITFRSLRMFDNSFFLKRLKRAVFDSCWCTKQYNRRWHVTGNLTTTKK